MMPSMKSLLFLLATVGTTSAFVAPLSATNQNLRHTAPSTTTRATELYNHKLVLVRHGESTWNDLNIFTGWADAALNEKGLGEAAQGGKLLKEGGFTFDVAYTSVLKRAIKTLWIILEELDLMYLPIVNTWRLNERHYGGLQGLNKQETVDKHGKDQVLIWRRSYDIPPPECDETSEYYPGNDPRYANVDKADLPKCESLQMTGERFMPMWESEIAPAIKSGKKVLIAAHGNTLRSLVKYLDNISEDEITGLNIPTGVPLVYELDDDLNVIASPHAIAPLQGMYLGDLDDVRARIEGVANQTK
mmetsp:Transcript_20230/g.43985  ORF Transcript_20230/g.43985 Transcript_20230/m.43985 type:complete len:303 (-) Transcript_20230:94-1002(-)|eukprot:CAMPEP_0172311560 /NCGR_PEP_ID=MMETSP1058-20130122/15134_1 /TAXON_ID=83371 /ORGANISM="Detonula confervacea, Strain CCMP 353" /LENGTH=302 /DNA_ID=CAMNT_0013024789 /DNA_START=85 /DNA_END=993 /DNA_ORIENTATION=+